MARGSLCSRKPGAKEKKGTTRNRVVSRRVADQKERTGKGALAIERGAPTPSMGGRRGWEGALEYQGMDVLGEAGEKKQP